MSETTSGAPAPIRVLIVDDHAVLRDSLAFALDHHDDIDVVAAVHDATSAISTLASTPVDVALVDYVPNGLDGIGLTSALHRQAPDVKVLMLTATDQDDVLVGAMEAGCAGFLTKRQTLDEVVDAVRTAAAGEPVVSAALLLRLLPLLRRRNVSAASVELTERELEVLRLMAGGATNQAMAEALYLSLHTVRNHVQSVLRKLEAHSKLEAVAIAVRNGILPASRAD